MDKILRVCNQTNGFNANILAIRRLMYCRKLSCAGCTNPGIYPDATIDDGS